MFSGGIDKLDVRIPGHAQMTDWLKRLLRDERPWGRPSTRYSQVYDLRPYSISALLHERYRYGADRHSKLEIVQAGCTYAHEIVADIQQLFNVDAEPLEIMRVDLFADTYDVPVEWFRANVTALAKRTVAEYGVRQVTLSEPFKWNFSNSVQTLHLGKAPDCFRIYDKSSQLVVKYKREAAEAPRGIAAPTFRDCYGFDPERLKTRVERQLSQAAIPDEIATLGGLMRNGVSQDPFATLRGRSNTETVPVIHRGHAVQSLEAIGFYHCVQIYGWKATRQMLNAASHGNASKIVKAVMPYLPSAPVESWKSDLLTNYRQGIMEQLASCVPLICQTDFEQPQAC